MLLKACSLIVAISPLILLPILRKWLLSMRTASYWWWIKKITNARDLINVLEDAIRGGYPILIIAEVIEQEALGTLVVNKLRGALKVAALKARKFGERKSQYLDDIGILTEGEDVYEETEGADQ